MQLEVEEGQIECCDVTPAVDGLERVDGLVGDHERDVKKKHPLLLMNIGNPELEKIEKKILFVR